VETQKESENQDMDRGMITSIDTVTQVSIKFQEKKKGNKKIGINVEPNTKRTYELFVCYEDGVKMYEYGRGGKCVCNSSLDTHTQELEY
jgi:hypothetical protein